MKNKQAGWNLSLLLTVIMMTVMAGSAFAAVGDTLIHNSDNLGTRYGKWGVTGGKYGQFTCATCHNKNTPNNVKRVDGTFTSGFGAWSSSKLTTVNVVFNSMTSFGNDQPAHTTSTSVCQVCHSKTAVHRYNKPVAQGDSNHKNANLTDCTSCHSHANAFKQSCDSCHGYPPTASTIGGPNGLVNPATNALIAGQAGGHGAHKTIGIDCTGCHWNFDNNHMTTDPKKIQLGIRVTNAIWPQLGVFGNMSVIGGIYTGELNTSLTNSYNWQSTDPTRTIINQAAGTATCSVYCHGNWAGANGGPIPSWVNGAAEQACGACHGASTTTTPTTNAHVRHAQAGAPNLGLTCDKCHGAHPDNTHISGSVKWAFTGLSTSLTGNPLYKAARSGETGKLAPSAPGSFGSCSNVYCHSNVQGANGIGSPTSFATVNWSTPSVNCDSCHWGQGGAFKLISTGSHRAHVSRGYTFTCDNCHNSAGSTTALHADGKIQVRMKYNGYTGVYQNNGKAAGVGGYSTCTTNCHKSVSPTWGGTLAANCLGCHGDKTSATLSGAHNKHTNDVLHGGSFNCIDCHATVVSNNVTLSNKTLHANNLINYSGALSGKFTGLSPATCSTQYCHTNGKGTYIAPPAWGSSFVGSSCFQCHGTVNKTTGAPDNVANDSHAKHNPAATDCWKCHFKTAGKNSGELAAGTVDHLDKTLDARLAVPFVSLTNYSGSYNLGARNCTATYCHGGTNPLPTPTWGNVGSTNCNSCHVSKPNGLSASHAFHVLSTSTNYNYTQAAANNSVAGNYSFNCAVCHGNTTANHFSGPVASGSDATIQFLYSSAGRGVTATNKYVTRTANVGTDARGFKYSAGNPGDCNSTYCHSDGKAVPGNGAVAITWSSTALGNCTACHGNEGNAATLSGAHNKHITGTSGGAFKCKDCHAPTITNADNRTLANKANHVNKMINYSGALAGRNKNCASFYCHSNGKGTAANPAGGWTGTFAANTACYQCHGRTGTTGAPDNVANDSHTKHAPTAAQCFRCHRLTASSTAGQLVPNTVDHLDGNIDARLSIVKAGFTSFSGVYNANKTCSATYCHGGSVTTPIWGTAGSTGCNKCHNATPSLPGAHGFHIMSTSANYSYTQAAANTSTAGAYNFTCASCHGNTTSLHADGPVQSSPASDATIFFGFSSAGKNPDYSASRTGTSAADAKGFKWTQGTVQACNATYCHSNGRGGNGAAPSINWASTTTTLCQSCHGNETNAATLSGAHNKHITGTSGGAFKCKDCHATTITNADNRTLANKANHVNKMINYSGALAGNNRNCASFYCHSNGKGTAAAPAGGWTGTFSAGTACYQCHGRTGTTGAPDNVANDSHTKHAPTAAQCFRCHRLTASSTAGQLVPNTVDHLDGNIDARLSVIKAGFTSFSGVYNANKTCSTTYCHGGSVTTPVWGTANSTGCNKCHNSTPTLGGAHSFHIMSTTSNYNYGNAAANTSTAGAYNFTCASCHGNTASLHADGPVQSSPASDATIFFGFSSAGRNPSYAASRTGASTTDTKGFKWTAGTAQACNATYCHSNGKGGNGISTTINWASSAAGTCAQCHGNEASSSASWGTGAHFKHFSSTSFKGLASANRIKCKDCHAPTITNADNRTLADKSKHVNKMINYSGQYAGKNKTCATIYCHSNGKGAYSNTIWTATNAAGCNFCHGSASAPLSGTYAHTKHLADGATCANCHSLTTTTNTTITGTTHIDGSVNLQQGGANFKGKAVAFGYPGGGTCSNISCHAPVGSTSPNATWGQAATCETCHPKSGLSGTHKTHMGALDLNSASIYYNMTANRSPTITDIDTTYGQAKTYGFGCANCHPMNPANHINGAIEVDMISKNVTGTGTLRFLNSTSATNAPNYTGNKCNNIYCHSNASRVTAELVYKQTPLWTSTFTGDRCAGCHDNQPSTGAHAAHAVGNHYDNVYNGKSGKVTKAQMGKANVAHGNPNNSTTIGCYLCHGATIDYNVAGKGNDLNTKCVSCHDGVTAGLKNLAVRITNLSNHANGSREIQFAQVFVKSKAQVRNESFKFYSGVWQRSSYKNLSTLSYDTAKVRLDQATTYTYSTPMNSSCSNVVCHNGKSPKWNLADWNDPNKCMDCHNQL